MRKIVFILFSVLFFVSAEPLRAQNIVFENDSVVFLKQVTELLEGARKKEGKDFIKDIFTPIWYGGFYSDFQRERIVETANFLQEKRIGAFPEFKNYLYTLTAFAKSGQSDESFAAWLKTLEKMIDSGIRRQFVNYLDASYSLFNERAFYSSASVTWKTSNRNYEFVYDSVPKIIFKDCNLICLAKGDSTTIYNTSGVYLPLTQIFEGGKGKVTWEKAGRPANETYAVFDKYTVKVKNAGFSVDSVLFTNRYFQRPLLGKLDELILANMTPEKNTYPRFSSYDQRLIIRNVFKNIDYSGGVSFRGARLLGSGTGEQRAELIFKKDGNPFASAKATDLAIFTDRVSTESASVTLYLEEDSITHPSVIMRYDDASRKLSLIRGLQGLGQSPFKSTFHQIDMYFEALIWKIDDPIIELGPMIGSTEERALFESLTYFKEDRFTGLRGLDISHPLYQLYRFSDKGMRREMHVDVLLDLMKMQYEKVIPMIIDYVNKGFLQYNFETKIITFNDKLYDFILFQEGKKDYDVLSFNSTINKGSNAQINLLNFDLRMLGVERIALSDSQSVAVFPTNQQLVLKKNRDFIFAGAVQAGRMNIYSKRSEFIYDDFKINLEIVDSVRMKCLAFEADPRTGRAPETRVQSLLENVRGELFVDHPTNRAGLKTKDYPTYPILNVTNNSYVFYEYDGRGPNKLRVQKGVYKRNKFYFKLDPFVIDSLDNYPNTSLDFAGLFVSAGILPDLRERLKLQTDYSLGFRREIGKDGLPLYGGKAHVDNQIRLNHTGLQADGTFTYLSVTADSKRLILLPDSARGMVGKFENKASRTPPEFPDINSNFSFLQYYPYEDYLVNASGRDPIKMIKNEALLTGALTLNPEGVTAKGSIQFGEAIMDSRKFKVLHHIIDADTAAFSLASGDEKSGLSFETNNVNAHVNFEERIGEFQSNTKDNIIKMNDIQYICFMDKFKWFMDKGDIELEASKEIQDLVIDTDIDYQGSNFYSIHPTQDSLNFLALKAKYDVKRNVLTAKEVNYIAVADARITPDSNKVVIRKNARMETLNNSSILANSITKYHNIYNATTNIASRKSYTSKGDYDYIDKNKNRQTIHFKEISVDTTRQTIAVGEVAESANFTLSPNFEYRGNVKLFANNKSLTFDGATRIMHNCEISKNWVAFKDEIDPENILIPISDNIRSEIARPLALGPVLTAEPVENYASFLSELKNLSDKKMLSAKGYLTYNSRVNEYQISNKDKLQQRNLPGNLVSIDPNTCRIDADGKINFNADLGQVSMEYFGKFNHKLGSGLLEYRGFLMLNFFFNEKVLEKMAESINKYPDLESIDIEKTYIEQAFKEKLGLEAADKLISELSLSGKIRRWPSELANTLVLGDVKFKYNDATKTFRSVGKIGVTSVFKEQVFKYINGHIEITHKRSGDEIDIYLEIDPGNWYYFNYSRGFMQAISSDEDFNTTITEEKEDKRKVKTSKGETPYQYRSTNKRIRDRFIDKFQ
ncbi:MAG: hypothetical protein ACXITV_00905 [Luteibaculaceae bacterium]